jgi:hypothetical protein
MRRALFIAVYAIVATLFIAYVIVTAPLRLLYDFGR